MANTTGKKFGGRVKGTSNKVTEKIRSHFAKLLSNNLYKLQNDLDVLEPKDRIKAMLELAKFVIPTLKATEIEFTDANVEFTASDAMRIIKDA